MNNLFLDGPIQIGKSTLIRKALAPWLGMDPVPVGGFSCQRIIHKEKTIAFRLGRAPEPIEVLGTQKDVLLADNVFKAFGEDGRVRVDLDVFNTMGVLYMLEAASGWQRYKESSEKGKSPRKLDQSLSPYKIMLLDEIGGHELLCERFYDVLLQLLDSDIPCIGVLKSRESTIRMTESMARKSHEKALEAEKILQRNQFLRELIGDGILPVEGNQESRARAYEQIEHFLDHYLSVQ